MTMTFRKSGMMLLLDFRFLLDRIKIFPYIATFILLFYGCSSHERHEDDDVPNTIDPNPCVNEKHLSRKEL
ncbi:Protein CBG27107 [Caenorhabditis briggsae]|uniref:Protein CBG27107 n=1 Tax=Caenorhabditis briggsae TaxID=6238 RepID=B6IHI2_CAEBR|nr:Protein CBG27107 [Caenorhabditis briggsae]CAR99362.1 Protein CBG27107 [Caenorhabditis briggsae]